MSDQPDGPTPPESFTDFMATTRGGFVYTGPDGRITFANHRVSDWLQTPKEALLGTKLSDHFPIARKVYYETHLAPLLRMQGYFDEVTLDLARRDSTTIPVFVSATEHHDAAGKTTFVRFNLYPAVERRKYERTLVSAKNQAASDNSRLREQLADHARTRLTAEERLSSAQQDAALREQFIAVLGHDLRNPLAAIQGAMRLIGKTPLNERASHIVSLVQQSADRMGDLIDNVMDFARGRLGGGLEISRRPTDLVVTLGHVIDELAIAWPDRAIERDLRLPQPVLSDGKRLGQLLSNLLANALVHGAADGPVRVTGYCDAEHFILAVSNTGEPIPSERLEQLFEPFTREDLRPSQQGLGLGLYIASEIARSHGGTLTVQSSPAETCFTLRMPLEPANGRRPLMPHQQQNSPN